MEATESGVRRFLAKDGVELLFADGAPLCLHCGARRGYNPQRMEGTGGAPEFVERLRSELPRLLHEDVEARGQIIAHLSPSLEEGGVLRPQWYGSWVSCRQPSWIAG